MHQLLGTNWVGFLAGINSLSRRSPGVTKPHHCKNSNTKLDVEATVSHTRIQLLMFTIRSNSNMSQMIIERVGLSIIRRSEKIRHISMSMGDNDPKRLNVHCWLGGCYGSASGFGGFLRRNITCSTSSLWQDTVGDEDSGTLGRTALSPEEDEPSRCRT